MKTHFYENKLSNKCIIRNCVSLTSENSYQFCSKHKYIYCQLCTVKERTASYIDHSYFGKQYNLCPSCIDNLLIIGVRKAHRDKKWN